MTAFGIIPTDAEYARVGYLRNLFNSARTYRSRRISIWQRSYKVLHNKSWSDLRDSWMPSPQASETFPIIASMVAWMTDQRPMIYLNPAVDPGSPMYEMSSNLARDLEKVMEANWLMRFADTELEKVLWDSMVFGTGMFKTSWDASLEEGLGDAVITRVDPFRFYPDPQARSLDEANFMIEARSMSMQELDRRYPGTAALLEDGGVEESSMLDERPELYASGRPPMANIGGLNGNSPRYGLPTPNARASLGDIDKGVTVYECWTREHQTFAPTTEDGEPEVDDRWRLTVISGSRVLFEAEAQELFGHGRHPYTRYVGTDTGEFWGISLVEHLTPLQLSLNRLLAAMQHHAELTGNPILLEDTRSGITRQQIVNKPGERLEKNPGGEVKWLEPPNMSPQMMELVKFYQGEMERVSGLSAIVRGASPQGRQARQVLDSIQEAAFVRVRMALRNLERALREVGWLQASLITENYTAPRIVAITGEQNSTPMVLHTRHFYMPSEDGSMPLRFSLWVQAGASLPTSRQARAQEADMLYAMGAIDREAVLEAHDFPNRQTVLQRIQQAIASGTFAPPGARQRTRGTTSTGGQSGGAT